MGWAKNGGSRFAFSVCLSWRRCSEQAEGVEVAVAAAAIAVSLKAVAGAGLLCSGFAVGRGAIMVAAYRAVTIPVVRLFAIEKPFLTVVVGVLGKGSKVGVITLALSVVGSIVVA